MHETCRHPTGVRCHHHPRRCCRHPGNTTQRTTEIDMALFSFKGNRWKDADEYKRARWAYEGQAASATKSAWFLGIGLLAMTGFAAMQTLDKHELATMGTLKWAVIETNRTTGDTVSVSLTDGKLLTTETA